jgi:hypothetical protein
MSDFQKAALESMPDKPKSEETPTATETAQVVKQWNFRESGTDPVGEVKESESKGVNGRSFLGFIKQLTTSLVGFNPRKYPDWGESLMKLTDAWNRFMEDHRYPNEMRMRAEFPMKDCTVIDLPLAECSPE